MYVHFKLIRLRHQICINHATSQINMQHSYRVLHNWIWELLSVALAAGLLIAIAALLALHDGKPAPDWGAHINLNALLAFLSTILRAMLVVVVSQVISQRKWDWYSRERARPLSDFQQFDSGSRGSLGALLLIPTILWKDLVALIAAVVLLASFLVGPFVQQASRTMECSFPEPGLNASLPSAHFVPRRGYFTPDGSSNFGKPELGHMMVVISATTEADSVQNKMSASCSTGNCTFPGGDPADVQDQDLIDSKLTTHSTVGMCSECVDVSPLVSTNEDGYKTLPNGFNLSSYEGDAGSTMSLIKPTSDLAWMGDFLTPQHRTLSRWAYINVTYLTTNISSTAAVCSLYPCLRTYTASVTNGQLSERQIRSDSMQAAPLFDTVGSLPPISNSLTNQDLIYTTVKSPCRVDGHVYDILNMSSHPDTTDLVLYDFTDNGGPSPYRYTFKNISAPEHCIYRQHPTFVIAISTILNSEIFDGYCQWYKGTTCRKILGSGKLENLGAEAVLQAFQKPEEFQFSDITRWFTSFADAMTNRYRFDYGTTNDDWRSYNIKDKDMRKGEIRGLAWQTTVCVSMRREWLLLPLCLTLVVAVLCFWTIATDWRYRHSRPVWKESILPLIFYGYKIRSQGSGLLQRQPPEDSLGEDHAGFMERESSLLEASELKTISSQILVRFPLPDSIEMLEARQPRGN
ncbi:hypothetical protein CDEST_15418 [Colletotrichum destructivum]|uniref:Uncharacterized protein n=1 Tax=Colletotrichum destructivum TaxID=34406 RepID=A0AAX4J484_9PEZI|nr:hypothetical protein CDEST_15418 [Colletotrichum destructivum]